MYLEGLIVMPVRQMNSILTWMPSNLFAMSEKPAPAWIYSWLL